MSENNILHSFTLTPNATKAIKAVRKRQKSRFVSNAILKYADNEPLNPRGQAHYLSEMKILQDRILDLERETFNYRHGLTVDPPLEASKSTLDPPLEAIKERGFLHWLRQRRQARQSKR
jgi:hypothetical protein